MSTKCWPERQKERHPLDYLGAHYNRFFKELGGPVAGSCDYGNKPSSI
jgi:hypothetical protein